MRLRQSEHQKCLAAGPSRDRRADFGLLDAPGCHGPPSAYLTAWTDHAYRVTTSLSPDRVIMVFNRRKQAGLHLMLG